METNIKILKFGGTSVGDAAAFQRAAQIVRANQDAPVVVVVSAMSGVTDALIAASTGTETALENLDEHFQRHLRVGRDLSAKQYAEYRHLIQNSRNEIIRLLAGADGPRRQDAVTSYGERLCAALFTMILEHDGIATSYVDARSCILTDGEYGNANPLMHEVGLRTQSHLKPLIESNRVPVLGGFIGATAEGVTTTLGRGSSDYTATLIGGALRAEEIQIWTDVDGVQTANPQFVTSTRTIPVISYEEAIELAVFGARVMHPKMIDPVMEDRIPIRIRNSRFPDQDGTLICAASGPQDGSVKAIVHRDDVVACVGDGLSNGSLGAANVRRVLLEVDPLLTWESSSPSNLITRVESERVVPLVRRLHKRIIL